MRRWVLSLAAICFAHAAGAKEPDPDHLRGSVDRTGSVPSPTQRWDAARYNRGVASLPAPVWTGFYIGAQLGVAAGNAKVTDPFGPSLIGDKVETPGFLGGALAGYNWQVPNTPLVLGVEADFNWLAADGTNTCLAFSGTFVSANCHVRPNWKADLTARLGWAYGHANHSLVYLKGGAALVHNRIDITTNATGDFVGLPPQTTTTSFTKPGWTVGAGVEHAITPAWSVKAEYDYTDIRGSAVAFPQGLTQPAPPLPFYFLTGGGTTRVSQSFQELKLGLNYRFGANPLARWDEASSAIPIKRGSYTSGWELETGARYWFSSGKFQKDLGNTTAPATAYILNSRLTYNSAAGSGELFGRLETPLNVFIKGNIGAGSITSGHLNDEDWVIFGGSVPYSNTVSNPLKGHIDNATLDVGYDFFRGAGYKLGALVGYNQYRENKSAYGCAQISNTSSDCVPQIASSVEVITEDDSWKSIRVGASGEIMVTDQVKLTTDVAYLPYVKFKGTDDHLLRALTIQESGTGRGVQIESILSYLVTDQFSVGVGGRYWSMWTTKNAVAEFSGSPCPCQTQPAKTERYGVFLQAAYKFDTGRL